MICYEIYETVEDFKSIAKRQYKKEQIFTKTGRLRKNCWAYLLLYKTHPSYGEGLKLLFSTSDFSGKNKMYSSMNIEKYRYNFNERLRRGKPPYYAKIYGIHLFKNKAEIDNMTEEHWNHILSKLENQYKEYLVNESLHRIKQDF